MIVNTSDTQDVAIRRGGIRLTIEEMREIAKKRGGVCLSSVYKNNHTKIIWKCKDGHVWKATANYIKLRDKWCPICRTEERKKRLFKIDRHLTIFDMQQMAKKRGGICVSDTYTGSHTDLRWRCEKGHEWETEPHNIKEGNWCPFCKESRIELKCRETFEMIYNNPFPKQRPPWLRNSQTGKCLELDGYNDTLRIAFEYNGPQHYLPGYYSKTADRINSIRYRDSLKSKLCSENRVNLITIPYTVRYHKIENYIRSELSAKGLIEGGK